MAKIILSEKQFKDYCRKILQNNRSEQYLKDALNETMGLSPSVSTENEESEYPEDVREWGRKVQELGLELSRLCGKYRFTNEELYNTLSEISGEYNAVCGDLNTYAIAPHFES